jgi:D-methionine transport system ATP-binding protein
MKWKWCAAIADRVAVIDAGRIVEEGQVWSVFADPQSDHESLLGGIRPQLPEPSPPHVAEQGSEIVLSCRHRQDLKHRGAVPSSRRCCPGSFRFVHGGVDHIQGQPVARFFIAVPTADKTLAGASSNF